MRDIVKACGLALMVPEVIGQSFVIMSDALDYGIGVPHLSQMSGMGYAEVYIPAGENYWFDTRKTRELLLFKPDVNSAGILEDAWRHYQGEDIGIIDGADYPRIIR